MLSPKTKINLARIIPFALIWLLFSVIYSLLERGLLGRLNYYPATGNPYHFIKTIIPTAVIGFVSGLVIGTIEILYLNKLFNRNTLIKKIVYKTLIYLGIIIGFLLLNSIVYNAIELKTFVFDKKVWKYAWIFFSDFSFWSVEVYITAVIGITLFYTEVSDNLGRGILNNFFTGKYHSPVEEERIFMFLDMKSSTTIAESLGHLKYFKMLKEYFSDLTDPIIRYSGEIYQYVGDEIVISWKLRNGLLNNNCILCFFAMKEAMKSQGRKYLDIFGTVPDFKGGVHLGKVITGEIGILKKEIIFTGDVLNTTARIQGLCNSFHAELLLSRQLLSKLELPDNFVVHALGRNELKGRDEKIELFSITQKP